MKIVLDISPLHTGHKTRGIGVYTRELSQALKKIDRTNQYFLTTRPRDVKHISLIHYPYFDLFFRTLPLKHPVPIVVTIHDLIPLVLPQYFKPGLRGQFHFWLQRHSLKQAAAIITDSQNSKRDIIQYFHIPPEKITVIPLAVPIGFTKLVSSRQLHRTQTKYHLPDRFLLYVGDINYHKNISGLLSAFAQVRSVYPNLQLVLVSRALAQTIPEAALIKNLILKLNLSSCVKLLTNVSLDPLTDLNSLYQLATAYVHPSFYEGFGLPVLEAMTAGTLTICSDVASLPETYDQAAITFDPHNPENMVRTINQALKLTKSQKEKLIAAGKTQADKFSWEKTAKATVKVYQQALYG